MVVGGSGQSESVRAGVLSFLRGHGGQWLSMTALERGLGLGPQRVHEQIDALREMGYRIEMLPAFGFRLIDSGEALNADLIECGLGTLRVGREVLVYQVTDSTNDVAWQHAHEPGYDGLAVFTECQRAGRGRLGRAWSAKAGSSVLCSVLLQEVSFEQLSAMTLLAGLSVAMAVEDCTSLRPRIKWPNDVMVSGRKLAGTMIESRQLGVGHGCVIGVGLNCLQEAGDFDEGLHGTAVSLRQALGGGVDRVEVAQALLKRLDYWIGEVSEGRVDALHEDWSVRCDDIGRHLTVLSDGYAYSGRVLDVSPTQGLLLQLETGPVRAFDGACTTVAR